MHGEWFRVIVNGTKECKKKSNFCFNFQLTGIIWKEPLVLNFNFLKLLRNHFQKEKKNCVYIPYFLSSRLIFPRGYMTQDNRVKFSHLKNCLYKAFKRIPRSAKYLIDPVTNYISLSKTMIVAYYRNIFFLWNIATVNI